MTTSVAVLTPILDPPGRIIPKIKDSPWPRDLIEAYARLPGPYTVENAETILEEEDVELFNGWLVRQEMTDYLERRSVGTLQEMLSISARSIGFGQAIPDLAECLLDNDDVVKPDASLISWQRLETKIVYIGPNQRPLLQGGPELVVEVRSPSNRRAKDRAKRTLYFDNNVQIIWDVDEKRKEIWVYYVESPDAPVRYSIHDEITCRLLPGWRRRLADIFAKQASAETIAGEVAEGWKAQGASKTLREVFPLLISMRFQSEPPPDLADRLAGCNLEQLQALQASVTTSTTLTDWLALLPNTK